MRFPRRDWQGGSWSEKVREDPRGEGSDPTAREGDSGGEQLRVG